MTDLEYGFITLLILDFITLLVTGIVINSQSNEIRRLRSKKE